MGELLKFWPVFLVVFGAGALQFQVFAQADSHETLKERTTMIAAGVQQLQEIHVAMDAEERGKEEARKEFCRDGKLPERECED